ncbi:MAG: hypothetical protein IKB86_01750 [Clostridia bacterium]|nr:hypothetical protein [Clostridia bacterium]
MSKQRSSQTNYRVYYGTDRNAALQPQYVPQPERKRAPKKKTKSQSAQKRQARKAEVARYTSLACLVVCVAAMGFLVVFRNAEIYSNNRQIRSLANEKTKLEIMLNTVEKDGSVGSELNSYFDIAQNQLHLQYPEQDDIVTVVCPAGTDCEDASANQENVNLYDSVLDWVSNVSRRIKSWA